VAEEAAEEIAPGAAEDDWAPPRELVAVVSALAALGCVGAVLLGVPRKWTAPTLGVLLLLGIAEALVGVGLVVRTAIAGRRSPALFVLAIVACALAAIGLAGILLLSGIV